jgi:hypothetical protein
MDSKRKKGTTVTKPMFREKDRTMTSDWNNFRQSMAEKISHCKNFPLDL